MANKTLFQTFAGRLLPKTDRVNEAGGRAYQLESRHALAQYAATGCLNSTYYASDREQLENTLGLCEKVKPLFIAKTAIYARRHGYMKDLPSLLASVLATQDGELLARAFPRVIDQGKMLRNFVQILRSGATGRKSLGTRPKRLVRQWLESRSDEQLFAASVGQSPSLADIVKMVHPKPSTRSREALYGYLIGRQVDASLLPPIVRDYERFKADLCRPVPDVPFQLLTALPLEPRHWVEIARRAPWQMTRMNLNTFARHGVFETPGMDELIAERLRDPRLIAKARVLPYQLFSAWRSASDDLPRLVRDALGDAMEIALTNVPRVDGRVYVLPDISGSMHCPVTGYRRGSTTAVRCIDVAALIAAAVLRKNREAVVIPFSDNVVLKTRLDPHASVMTNAEKLASLPSGGTDCSAPLRHLNHKKAKGDLVLYVSDNESWIDTAWGGRGTATVAEWTKFKHRNRRARMACLDIQPYVHSQAKERDDILNIGGFSDQVFRLLADFARGGTNAGYWVQQIESIEIDAK